MGNDVKKAEAAAIRTENAAKEAELDRKESQQMGIKPKKPMNLNRRNKWK